MPSDTLAARHLETLRKAADLIPGPRLRDAAEWVGELVDVLALCEACGMPSCSCQACDNCNRMTDEEPDNKDRTLCLLCREDLG